jgi:hypothetical protein
VAVNREALVRAYWQFYCDSTSEDRTDRLRADETWWAWEQVERSVADADDDVVELLCALAACAPDESALAYLGAGPVEGLLGAHASRFGDPVDSAARRDERFRTALRCAWFDNKVDPQLAARLRRFGQPP